MSLPFSSSAASADPEGNWIYCSGPRGGLIPVLAERLVPQVEVYAVLLDGDQLLTVSEPHSGQLSLPGGRLTPGELPEGKLRQAVRFLTGFTPQVGRLIHAAEQFVLSQSGEAFHIDQLFWEVKRPLTTTSPLLPPNPSHTPTWLAVSQLKRTDLLWGYAAVQSLLQAAA